ncbi:MAG: hypothetical protein HFF08_03990 [Oscillospiraceae bacterium]|nr:hypothetical protein [Oscillospiraceae bacterium]
MITLKEAFKLCRIDDREVVHFCDSVEQEKMWSWPMTGKEVREKYDMKNTIVTSILPHFCCGEFKGFSFVLRKH